MTTSAATWCPAFANANFPWLKSFPIEQVFEGPIQDYRIFGTWRCRLCEQTKLRRDELEDHARHHKFEYRQWRAEQKAQQELVV